MTFLIPVLFAVLCSAACDNEWSVQLRNSSTTIEDSFDASISGSAGIYAISIGANSGTVTQGDRITNVVANFQIPWDNTTLYSFIGADSTGIMMGWAYCSGDQLTDIWLEDTTGDSGFTKPEMTGACDIQQTTKTVQLTTVDECYTIDPPSNVPTIDGKDFHLSNGAPGTVLLDQDTYDVLPFAIVDCKTCRSTTLDGGWVEIHAVMRSPSNICLGIFYLQVIPKDTIQLSYMNCFFSQVEDTEFEAQYQLSDSSAATTFTGSATSIGSGSLPIDTSAMLSATSKGEVASTTVSTTSGITLQAVSTSSTSTTTSTSTSTSTSSLNAISTTNTPNRASHVSALLHSSLSMFVAFFSIIVVMI